MTETSTDWDASAEAWITEQGEAGDFGRQYVLDAPMIDRLRSQPYQTALDVGCGEGRFCRIMQAHGIQTVGIDPTDALIAQARRRDPGGDYRVARAEALNVPAASFDLVVSYLSLIDISDLASAVGHMVSALRPGGALLIANLNSYSTAGGWTKDENGTPHFSIDHYLDERENWIAWRGIRVRNWHRPMSTYMSLLLSHGLVLRHFAEPTPTGGDPSKAARHRRVPYFHVMEWVKPTERASA